MYGKERKTTTYLDGPMDEDKAVDKVLDVTYAKEGYGANGPIFVLVLHNT